MSEQTTQSDPADRRPVDRDRLESLLIECLDVIDEAPDRVERILADNPDFAPALRDRLRMLSASGLLHQGELPPPPFERLGPYRVHSTLGHGGMGIVYLAEDESLGRSVALKVLRTGFLDSEAAARRFEREARAIARLRHPNIVRIFGTGESDGVRWIAMEFVPGRGLDEIVRDAIATGTRVPTAQLLAWGRDVGRALASAHAAGLVHRDVKPSNIRITPEGHAMLLDFGLAKELSAPALTRTGAFQGSPVYAAPEQIDPEWASQGPRIDVYGLGVTLYECATLTPPFAGSSASQILHRIVSSSPEPPRKLAPGLPRDLETVLLEAIERDPEHRYADAAAFADDLERVLGFQPILAHPPSRLARGWRWAKRNPRLAGLAGLATLVVLVLVALLVQQSYAHADMVRQQARSALAEAESKLEQYGHLRKEQAALEAEVADLLRRMVAERLTTREYDVLDRNEGSVLVAQNRRATLFLEILSDLERARRFDPDIEGTEALRLELYKERWREASDRVTATRHLPQEHARASAAESFYRKLVAEKDVKGASNPDFLRAHPISMTTSPAGADVHLFAMEESPALRVVPVPYGADGKPAATALEPGTWCLRVLRDCPPLVAGDLVLRVYGEPIEGCALVAQGSGDIARGDRLIRVDTTELRRNETLGSLASWHENAEKPRVFVFRRGTSEFTLNSRGLTAAGIRVVRARELAGAGGAPADVLHSGRRQHLELPAGLALRETGRPLLPAPTNRIGQTPLRDFALRRGSWLLLLRKAGYEDQRVLIAPWSARSVTSFALPLRLSGEHPPGFVSVVKFYGQGTFLIQDREVRTDEYLEFLNEPETLARVDASETPRLFPRYPYNDRTGGYWKRDASGRYELPSDWPEDAPILGISFEDAREYATWLSDRSRASGSPWRYRLPKRTEWESAGLSGTTYVFGNRFRAVWLCSCYSQETPRMEPVLSYPLDESPAGIYDLGGSALEWIDDWFWKDRGLRALAGGSWAHADPKWFTAVHRIGSKETDGWSTYGMRLVAEKDD